MAVTVWFYNPEAECVTGANLVNKLVAGLYPPFCHTELQFPNGEACSIVMHDSVRMRVRTFDEAFYTGLVLSAPPQALNAAMALARRHVHAGTPFGVGAARTFCSKEAIISPYTQTIGLTKVGCVSKEMNSCAFEPKTGPVPKSKNLTGTGKF